MTIESRALAFAALGDTRRLQIVDQLANQDLTVGELADLVNLEGNLLAHHLDMLDRAGLIQRRVSDGDHRRRYVSLRWVGLPSPISNLRIWPETVIFVCTNNSARSQFAAALWQTKTGGPAFSAGNEPAARVDPTAIKVASEFDIDISECKPANYDSLPPDPDLLVSVCDRARESGLPSSSEHLHWSVPDPLREGSIGSFRTCFSEIVNRVENLIVSSNP